MSNFMDEVKLWTPVYISATSWFGQYHILSKYPAVASEYGLNLLTQVIEEYREQQEFIMVDFLERKRTTLEICIEDGEVVGIGTHLIPQEERLSSLVLSLKVLIQSSSWELCASQLIRGPELLLSLNLDFSEEVSSLNTN